jgi:hypothetical protein
MYAIIMLVNIQNLMAINHLEYYIPSLFWIDPGKMSLWILLPAYHHQRVVMQFG